MFMSMVGHPTPATDAPNSHAPLMLGTLLRPFFSRSRCCKGAAKVLQIDQCHQPLLIVLPAPPQPGFNRAPCTFVATCNSPCTAADLAKASHTISHFVHTCSHLHHRRPQTPVPPPRRYDPPRSHAFPHFSHLVHTRSHLRHRRPRSPALPPPRRYDPPRPHAFPHFAHTLFTLRSHLRHRRPQSPVLPPPRRYGPSPSRLDGRRSAASNP